MRVETSRSTVNTDIMAPDTSIRTRVCKNCLILLILVAIFLGQLTGFYWKERILPTQKCEFSTIRQLKNIT
jgi:hypothetical protein